MKNFARVIGLCVVLASGTAFAQTCATPGGFTPGSNPTATGGTTTCGLADSITDICSGSLGTTGPEAAYQFTTGAAGPFATQFSLTNTTGDVTMFLLSSACAGSSACASESGDTVAGQGTETMNVSLAASTTYWVVVTSFAGAPNNCGAFSLSANGTLPVQLQKFSVE